MRILVIEDEARILSFLARGPRSRGILGRGCERRTRWARSRGPGAVGSRRCSTCCSRASTGSTSSSAASRAAEAPVLILSARADLRHEAARLRARCSLTTSRSRSRSTSCSRASASSFGRSAPDDDGNSLRVGRLVARPRAATGETRRCRLRSLRSRVPAAPPPRAACRRGDQPGAPARRRLGLHLRPGLERRRGLRPAAAEEARADAPIETVRHAGYRLAA